MRPLLFFLLTLYQKTLSPDHGFFSIFFPFGYCRFFPSCSQYMRDGVCRDGMKKGVFRGIGRIARCHPWSKGGIEEYQ